MTLVALAPTACAGAPPHRSPGTHRPPSAGVGTAPADPRRAVFCPQSSGGRDALTGMGATIDVWRTAHQQDPQRYDAYYPPLNDGLDRYGNVSCSAGGRVAAYRLNFVPAISLDEARAAVRGEMPGDAQLVSEQQTAQCDLIQYRSPTLAAVLGSLDSQGAANAAVALGFPPSTPPTTVVILLDATSPGGAPPTSC